MELLMTEYHMYLKYIKSSPSRTDHNSNRSMSSIKFSLLTKTTWKLKTTGGILVFRVLVQVCPCPHREVEKILLYWGLSFDAVVGPELLATALADKRMATVLPNYKLVSRSQRLESPVTYITRVNPLYIVCSVPPHWSYPATTWIPSKTHTWQV